MRYIKCGCDFRTTVKQLFQNTKEALINRCLFNIQFARMDELKEKEAKLTKLNRELSIENQEESEHLPDEERSLFKQDLAR